MDKSEIFIICYMIFFASLIIGLTVWVSNIRMDSKMLSDDDSNSDEDSITELSKKVNSNITGLFAVMIILCVITIIIIPTYIYNKYDLGTKYAEWKTGSTGSSFGITPTSATFTSASEDIDAFGSDFGVDAF